MLATGYHYDIITVTTDNTAIEDVTVPILGSSMCLLPS